MELGADLGIRKRAGWEASEESIVKVQSLPMLTKNGKNKLIFVRHDFAAVFLVDALKKGRSPD